MMALILRLKDLVALELGADSYSAISELNKQPAAAIAIYQSPGANALDVADAVYATLVLYSTALRVAADINRKGKRTSS